MCVLIIKPKGAEAPSKEILKACVKVNPHGFGIGTPNGVFKTLNAEEFIATVGFLALETPAIIHCRLATHGSVKKSNCHPFEAQDYIFAHNGIFHSITPVKDLTDSETAFKQIFLPLITANKGFNNNVKSIIATLTGFNKFAFLNKITGKITTFGEFEKIDGCFFSNLRWQNAIKINCYNSLLLPF
jgi:hypothetical protein